MGKAVAACDESCPSLGVFLLAENVLLSYSIFDRSFVVRVRIFGRLYFYSAASTEV